MAETFWVPCWVSTSRYSIHTCLKVRWNISNIISEEMTMGGCVLIIIPYKWLYKLSAQHRSCLQQWQMFMFSQSWTQTHTDSRFVLLDSMISALYLRINQLLLGTMFFSIFRDDIINIVHGTVVINWNTTFWYVLRRNACWMASDVVEKCERFAI